MRCGDKGRGTGWFEFCRKCAAAGKDKELEVVEMER
jgi:hypothetical protein